MKSGPKHDLEVKLTESLRQSSLLAVTKSSKIHSMFHPHPALSNYHFPNLMFLTGPHPAGISPASQLPSPTLHTRCYPGAAARCTNLMMRVNGQVRAKGGPEMHILRVLVWSCLPSHSFLMMDMPFIW